MRRKIPNVFSEEELHAIFKATKSLKYRTLFKLLAYSGLRISEAIQLRVQDIDWNTGVIRPRPESTKYNKEEPAFMPQFMLRELEVYINSNYSTIKKSGFLFPPDKGQALHIHKQIAWRELKGVMHELGLRHVVKTYESGEVRYNYRVHTFRHYFGSSVWKKTRNLKLVQKLLRHSDIEASLVYIHTDDQLGVDVVNDVFSGKSGEELFVKYMPVGQQFFD